MTTVVMCVHVFPGEQGCQLIRGELRTKETVEAGTRNTELTLDEARRRRLWDRQADAYVDAIAGIRHQQNARQREL